MMFTVMGTLMSLPVLLTFAILVNLVFQDADKAAALFNKLSLVSLVVVTAQLLSMVM